MTNQELIEKLNNNEYITREEWLSIGPVTRDILLAVYDQRIKCEDRFNNKYWVERARKAKAQRLQDFDTGKTVFVTTIDSQYDHGYTTETYLYSDGSIENAQFYDGD